MKLVPEAINSKAHLFTFYSSSTPEEPPLASCSVEDVCPVAALVNVLRIRFILTLKYHKPQQQKQWWWWGW